jgi:glycosyltransferase involved in cell wall biosynthesis
MDRSSVAIVIPAYNEQDTIGQVVSRASAHGVPIVVDDASKDDTKANAEHSGAIVIRHEQNRGYDGALNSGFAAASERDFEFIITMDADGQHDESLIERFLSLLAESADIVVGVRPSRARLSERVFCFVTRKLYGIRDPLCGMKGYRMELYRALGHFDSYGSIGTELTIFAAKHKYRIKQIDVPIARREAGSTRFGRSLKAEWKIFRALLKGLFA